ncbi:MAG: SMP-30/gluconolactonase/LRE family protein [Candidatus Lambdaproteobacteria bacterium]|nr:SMP-30/gluconolactonase/LRE family protein [Candidatus Lambdaproteobacteria bacterium]
MKRGLRNCLAVTCGMLLVAAISFGSAASGTTAAPSPILTLLAGDLDTPGSTDGTGSAARFNYPRGVATDSSGNLYVVDQSNNTIRKITPAGVVTTLAGTAGQAGSSDGTGSAARFDRPLGVTVDGSGNLYVSDHYNFTIRKITPAGVVTTLAGAAGVEYPSHVDAAGAAAHFRLPSGIAVDRHGNAYVGGYFNHIIRKITPAGNVTTVAGAAGYSGSTDGTGAAARFDAPLGVVIDSSGMLYVADSYNHTIRKVSPAGVVTTLAGTARMTGRTDGSAAAARFNGPQGIAVDQSGNVYVADWYNSAIRRITPAGAVTTVVDVAGQLPLKAGQKPSPFNHPEFLTVHGDRLYITVGNAVAVVSPLP